MRRGTFKGERCGVDGCRSKRYRVREDDQQYCTNGHLKEERSTEHFQDDDEWNSQGKITRKKRSEDDLTSGNESQEKDDPQEQYLHCYQLILRKQIVWLVQEKGLPAELEVVVHDLWAFRLRCLKPEARGVETDTENEDSSSSRVLPFRRLTSRPKLVDCVVLWYLAILLLRLPITISDLHSWVATEGRLMYYQAQNLLPKEMLDEIDKALLPSLEPNELSLEKLQTAIYDTARGYCDTFDMEFPPINYPLLILRYMEDLALPLEVYSTLIHLTRLVPCTFTYTFTTRKRQHKKYEMPETLLAIYFVVAAKFLFPFPENDQQPRSPVGIGATTVDWRNWANGYAEGKGKPNSWLGLDYETFSKVIAADVSSMDDTDIDNYLDWYSGFFVPGEEYAPSKPQHRNRNADEFMDGLSTALPMAEPNVVTSNEEKEEHIIRVLNSLRGKSTFPERHERGLNVGGSSLWYNQYRTPEELHGPALEFHEAVRKHAGIPLESLLEGVLRLEEEMRILIDLKKRNSVQA